MRSPRATARQRLDQRLSAVRPLTQATPPPRGWIRAIRDALGMSSTDLARRMGVGQSRIAPLEHSEVDGTVRLATLERAAAALGCTVAYALIPHEPLERMVQEQARKKAAARLGMVAHTMRLEDQGLPDDVVEEQLADLAGSLVDKRGLWADR